MKSWLRKKHAVLRLAAILLAILLWAYVVLIEPGRVSITHIF